MSVSERLDQAKTEFTATLKSLEQVQAEDQRLRTRAVQLQGAIEALQALHDEPTPQLP